MGPGRALGVIPCDAMLADLKLPGALEAVHDILAEVDRGSVTAGEALERLLGCADPLAQQPRASDRDAILLASGHEGDREVRLFLPALNPA
jgi:hypothetical protein